MEPSSVAYKNGAMLSFGTRFFVRGNRRSDCPSACDEPYRILSRYSKS